MNGRLSEPRSGLGPVRDGRRLAVGTLTVLPVRPPEAVDGGVARAMVVWAPLVFVPIAALVALLAWGVRVAGLPALVAGLLGVGLLAWLTRAIHLDGLADTADGLGSGRPAERALQIMRSGDVGPMGVVTLIVVLGLQAACLGELADRPLGAVLVVVALCAGRGALAVVGCGAPAARPDGLGAVFARSVPRWLAVALWVVLAGVLAGACALAGGAWWQGVLAAALAVGAARYLVRLAVRRLGGITGDVLGAAVELATTVLLVVVVGGAG